MSMRKLAAVAGLLALGAPLSAQERLTTCAARDRVGYIGVTGLRCNCTITRDANRWVFRSEPSIIEVERGSPADGVLRPEDTVVSVNGQLITTSEGGRLFANPAPGEPMRLVVRRDGRDVPVVIEPASVCDHDPRRSVTPQAPSARVASSRQGAGPIRQAEPPGAVAATRVGRTPPSARPSPATPTRAAQTRATPATVRLAPGVPQDVLPTAWFGFGISCNDCGWERRDDRSPMRWFFGEPPELMSVERGSPAGRAGLHSGDMLTHIDGISLTTPEGGRRFGAVEPGEDVQFTYRRGNGAAATVRMTAQRRPSTNAALEALVAQTDTLRRYIAQRPAGAGGRVTTNVVAESEYRALVDRLSRQALTAANRVPEGRYEQVRYAGAVGNTSVEVRGNGSVITTILEQGKDIVIITGDAQIRIRVRDEPTRNDR